MAAEFRARLSPAPSIGRLRRFVQRTATVTERAPVQLRWSTTKVFELEPCPEFQQQPDERLHGPQSSSSQLLVPARSTRCSRWLILVVFVTGRSLAALQLSGFTSVTAFLAPVWHGRELLGFKNHHHTNHRRPSQRTAALRESAQCSACSCGRSGYGGGSAQRLATCAWLRAAPRQQRGSPRQITSSVWMRF